MISKINADADDAWKQGKISHDWYSTLGLSRNSWTLKPTSLTHCRTRIDRIFRAETFPELELPRLESDFSGNPRWIDQANKNLQNSIFWFQHRSTWVSMRRPQKPAMGRVWNVVSNDFHHSLPPFSAIESIGVSQLYPFISVLSVIDRTEKWASESPDRSNSGEKRDEANLSQLNIFVISFGNREYSRNPVRMIVSKEEPMLCKHSNGEDYRRDFEPLFWQCECELMRTVITRTMLFNESLFRMIRFRRKIRPSDLFCLSR